MAVRAVEQQPCLYMCPEEGCMRLGSAVKRRATASNAHRALDCAEVSAVGREPRDRSAGRARTRDVGVVQARRLTPIHVQLGVMHAIHHARSHSYLWTRIATSWPRRFPPSRQFASELPRPPPKAQPPTETFASPSQPRAYYTRPKPRDLPPYRVDFSITSICTRGPRLTRPACSRERGRFFSRWEPRVWAYGPHSSHMSPIRSVCPALSCGGW